MESCVIFSNPLFQYLMAIDVGNDERFLHAIKRVCTRVVEIFLILLLVVVNCSITLLIENIDDICLQIDL